IGHAAQGQRLGGQRTGVREPRLRRGGIAPWARGEMRLELRVPLLDAEIAQLPPRGLQAELHRRIRSIQRPESGEPLAELEAALRALTALAAIGEKRAPA